MEKLERNLKILKEYNDGVSMTELVTEYKLHRSTIQRILKRHGTKLHKNKSFIKCDKKFFSTYTKESCYWAGFILADGNIRKNRNTLQIKLASVDKKHLFNFLKSIKCNEFDRVKEYNYKHPYVSLGINLDEFKCDLLVKFDIGPQKTFTSTISDKIPTDMLRYFILGYMDGDGSVTKTSVPSVYFTGTVDVLNKISAYIKDIVGVELKSKNNTPSICAIKNGVGHISYSGKNAKKTLDHLYENSTTLTRLERKFTKFNELFSSYLKVD